MTELSANASAITYWVSESDGWHVVTTVDAVVGQDGDANHHAVVRFSSVLLPSQSQLISVLFSIGEQQQVLRIRRRRRSDQGCARPRLLRLMTARRGQATALGHLTLLNARLWPYVHLAGKYRQRRR